MSSHHKQPRANKTDAGNGSNGICRVIDASRSPSPDPSRSATSRMKTLPLKGKGRPFLMLNLKLLVCWLAVMCVAFMTEQWLGIAGVILIAVGTLITLMVVQSRSMNRLISALRLSTSCPQCGQCPMAFTQGFESDCGFLICEHCKIEWNIGQV